MCVRRCPRLEGACTASPCRHGGTCLDHWSWQQCQCVDGFTGTFCEKCEHSCRGCTFPILVIYDSFLTSHPHPAFTSRFRLPFRENILLERFLSWSFWAGRGVGVKGHTTEEQSSMEPTGHSFQGHTHIVRDNASEGTQRFQRVPASSRFRSFLQTCPASLR